MSETIDKAKPVTQPVEPMTTLTLRVPTSLVDELKTAANASHRRHTALARALLEAGLHPSSSGDLESRVTRLEHMLTS